MKHKFSKIVLTVIITTVMCLSTACSVVKITENVMNSSKKGTDEKEAVETQSFADAHDAFTTTLAREDNDDDDIPAPPEGVFDLVHYSSKVGDLAAYVSSDPGDGQKHPMIIWVVGGWGNGIDDFPWRYPEWDDDQTGSAFWQAGVLTMYPSFRGGNGNPGNYETLFGEVDDIVSAYEYAASLPYVDSNRIYLGGHSTGGTRALLASEYTDKFRAVFAFGVVDKIEYHNNSQFTFDTNNKEEYKMRSPIYWLDSVKSPTFLIEGSDGNSANLKNIQKTSTNENIHCYVIDGADHFSVLAPLTRVVAQKIIQDTGTEPNISITQEELDTAMDSEPEIPMPVMEQHTIEELGMNISYPYLWNLEDVSEEGNPSYMLYSRYEDNNIWDMSILRLNLFTPESGLDLQIVKETLESDGYDIRDTTINELPGVRAVGQMINNDGTVFNNDFVVVQKEDAIVTFDFLIYEDFGEDANPLFDAIINSVSFTQ